MTDDGSQDGRPEGIEAIDSEGVGALLDVARRMNAAIDLDAVLDTIVDSLVSIVRADRGFLMLADEKGNLHFTIARDKRGQPLEEKKFLVSQGVVGEVAATGETRLIDDAANSDAYQARMSIISLQLRTILCVALKTQQGVVGVIYVDSNAITRRFTEQDVPLVEAFAAQAAATIERVRLLEAERDRDRMRQQLEVASEIQRTFLPSRFPDIEGVSGAVATVPAHHVGGDFYDVIRLPRGRVGVMVGDVAGKGVPGAIFGARIMSDVRYQALYHDDVAETLFAVNNIVAERVTRGMFVTFIYAAIDPATGIVTYGNAGHLAPLVRRADGSLAEWPEPASCPLGVLPDCPYEAGTLQLAKGDVLVLLSDGIGDAVGPGGTRFGDDRVRATIASGPGDAKGLVRNLLEATARVTGARPQADDQTLLAASLR